MRSGRTPRLLRLALDWTANTTHTALLVAEASGLNAARGLRVTFVEPTHTDAPDTPLDGVVSGCMDVGIAPCDQVLAESCGLDRVACVAALTATDISAICVNNDSLIVRPKDLAGQRFGSCGYPLERACLEAMCAADGGAGGVLEVCPPERSQTEDLLLQGHVDCAWLYRSWEVLRAERAGISLREFRPREFGIPFGYMNTVVVARSLLATPEGKQTVRELLAAAADGALTAAADPAHAGRLLASMVGSSGVSEAAGLGDADFNRASIEKLIALGALAPVPGSGERWGAMEGSRWSSFVEWAQRTPAGRALLQNQGAATGEDGQMLRSSGSLFTNEYLRPPLPHPSDAQYHVTG